jgi:hypothetical protein
MATITVHPGDDIQAAINQTGTIQFAAGTYTLTSPLNIPSNVTLQGASDLSTILLFNLPSTDTTYYGFVLEGNSSNIAIKDFDIISNHGIMCLSQGHGYNAISFSGNQCQYGDGKMANGTLVFGIYVTIPTANYVCEYNFFHDSPSSNRNWEMYFVSGKITNNRFDKVFDGGHLVSSNGILFAYNYGTNMGRMGQEIQNFGPGCANLTFDHNVFYDYVNAYNDTEGMSVCPDETTNVVVTNNYIRLNLAEGASWGKMIAGAVGGPNRFGYGVECIAPDMVVENNIIVVSNTAGAAFATGEHCTAIGNTVYGGSNSLWGVYAGDGSPQGAHPSWTMGAGNVTNNGLGGAPNPPPNTFAGPQYASGGNVPTPTPVPPTPTPPTSNIPGLVVVTTDTGATLTWTSVLTNVSVHTFTPTDDCGTVHATGSLATVSLTNLNAGWGYSFTVSGTSAGTTITGTVTGTTSGQSPNGTTVTQAVLVLPPAPPGTIAGLAVTTTDTGATLIWTSALTSVSIHTFTPVDDCGTVTATGSLTTATLTNLNAGWGYSFTVSGTNSAGAIVSSTVTGTTTGQSPNGTTSKQAILVTAPALLKTVVVTTQYFSDGSTKETTTTILPTSLHRRIRSPDSI